MPMDLALRNSIVSGGGNPPFGPTQLSNLALWLNAQKGLATGGARQFTSANSEHLIIADNAALSTGDIDFTFAAWVRYDDVTGAHQFAGKGWDSANQREWVLDTSSTAINFRVSDDGVGTDTTLTSSITAAIDTWYFIVVWHDASANTLNIQINNGTADSTPHSTGVFDGTDSFAIGRGGTVPTVYHNGRGSRANFWKRTLTPAEKTWLYNFGVGRVYGEFGQGDDGSDLKTSLIASWNLNEASGNAIDAHSTNDLTDTNTVTAADGPLVGLASDTSGNDTHGILNNMDTINDWSSDVPSGATGQSIHLPDSTDWIDLGVSSIGTLINGASAITITCWLKYESLNASEFTNILFTEKIAGTTGVAINIRGDGGSVGKIRGGGRSNSGEGFVAASSTGLVSSDTWTFVTMLIDYANDEITFGIDGTLESAVSSSFGSTSYTHGSPSASDAIGGEAVNTIDAYLDDLRIYTTKLTQAQVTYLYENHTGTPSVPGDDPGTGNLVAHWKFDDGPQATTITDGDPVISWESQDGNRYLFNQATAAKRPLYTASAINSKPGVTFDGTDDLLRLASGALTSSAGVVFYVIDITTPGATDAVMGSGDEAVANEFISFRPYHSTPANDHAGLEHNDSGSSDIVVGDTAIAGSTTYIIMVASSGTAYEIRVNGNAETEEIIAGTNSGDWFGDLTGLDSVTIGALKINSEARHFNGIVSEIVVYSEDKTTAEKQDVESYLASKYGVSLP